MQQNLQKKKSLIKILASLTCFLLIFCAKTDAMAKELIFYSHLTNGYWQIWCMEPDGTHKRQITYSPFDKREPGWIASQNKIMFRSNNGELFLIDFDGKNEKQILTEINNIKNPRFCAATEEVVFVSFFSRPIDSSDIWKATLDGTQKTLLTRDKILKYHPAVSPKGNLIAFVKDSSTLKRSHTIWIMNSDGSAQRPLTFENGRQTQPSFAPDQKKIIFSSNHLDRKDYDLYTVSITSGKIKPIIRNPGLDASPHYSPQGDKIIFVSNRTGSQQLWVADRNGQNAVQLTDDVTESVDPIWVKVNDPQGE